MRLWFHGSAELVVWVHVWSFCVVDCVVSVGANVFLELLFSACCCDVDVIFELSSIRCLLLCDVESGKLRFFLFDLEDNLQELANSRQMSQNEHPLDADSYWSRL